ncbi:hypothetical protein JQC91_16705 [Jannaschia sp. Os4]|uniref:hypothetical protein n=1 Tax=Jannaschia sp. Os4 TaxID=2807617 RepID=UPI0019399A22|nr:hypothetical protein [Jannaschia sp. Os4]MBM2577948.1 hypothetical protein [Jannaschia sp. Os4]
MSGTVGALVLLLPWTLRAGPTWRLWAFAAVLYPAGTALSAALVLALPGLSLAIPLERVVLAAGLAGLVALALWAKGRDGPAPAFWMAHLGLVAALVAGGFSAQAEVLRFVGTMGLLLGALGAAMTVWHRS